eukprot:12465606-Alexandrium_andersonii.AAC.1
MGGAERRPGCALLARAALSCRCARPSCTRACNAMPPSAAAGVVAPQLPLVVARHSAVSAPPLLAPGVCRASLWCAPLA